MFMNKRITIVLPKSTINLLDRVTTRRKRSQFIDRAIRHYVATQSRENLRKQLKVGYRANAERDLHEVRSI